MLHLSAMAFDLERFVRMARLEQLEECGPNAPAAPAAVPPQESRYYPDGTRAVIHPEDAPTDFSFEPRGNIPGLRNQHDFVQYLVVPGNGFKATDLAARRGFTPAQRDHLEHDLCEAATTGTVRSLRQAGRFVVRHYAAEVLGRPSPADHTNHDRPHE